MSSKPSIKLSTYPKEVAVRSGEFQLLPSNLAAPIILSQPIKNFNQYTWVVDVKDGIPTYQNITPTSNIINMLKGTSFSMELRSADPSNASNPSSTSTLSFHWKKDEASLYELNNQNEGKGISGLFISKKDSLPELSGVYTCEVANAHSAVESDPVELNIIDPLKHPKLHKNLLLNSDGDGGLNGWQADGDVIVRPFLLNVPATRHFGSFRLGGFVMIDFNENGTSALPTEFYFSLSSHAGLFYNPYTKLLQNDPTFADINVKSDPTKTLDEGELWLVEGVMPQILPNEDYNRSEYAGFFPGLLWMDNYNKNIGQNTIGLYSEFKGTNPNYFTRDKLKFEKFGGKQTSTITQTVDVSELSNFIDGSVYGVKYLTSQFFAYVGVGITDYKIKIQTADGTKTFNYYIADSETVYDKLVGYKGNPNFVKSENPNYKIEALPGTDIEIIPQCYDKTTITLTYLDDRGLPLKTETIQGPDETDIWAVKEKVYFPLTLWGLYRYIKPNNNNITVFGQKYTNTDAIPLMFEVNKRGSNLSQENEPEVPSPEQDYSMLVSDGTAISAPGTLVNSVKTETTDKAVKFLLNKFDFANPSWGGGYPGYLWYGGDYTPNTKFYYQALNDYGAAAMFGVGKDIVVPKNTKSVKIDVTFTHTSTIQSDTNPEIKNWQAQELYTDEYGQNSGTSRRLIEYGYPRCGITKMKFVVTPNDIKINDETISYSLPPSAGTVLGLLRAKYSNPDAYNTADASDYKYELVQPSNLPIPTSYPDPFISLNQLAQYRIAQQKQATVNLNDSGSVAVNARAGSKRLGSLV